MKGIPGKTPSLVLDTNIVLSGLLWQGVPHELLHLAREDKAVLFTSTLMLYELQDVLERDKWRDQLAVTGNTPDGLMDQYLTLVRLVETKRINFSPLLDLSDNKLLATGIAAQVNAIVTRDRGVLRIARYENISIFNEIQALVFIKNNFVARL